VGQKILWGAKGGGGQRSERRVKGGVEQSSYQGVHQR